MRPTFKENTPAEEAAIQRGIEQDPDNPEWTAADFASARPAVEVMPAEVYAGLVKRRATLYTKVIAATVSEAPHVLDGLMHHAHQTDFRIAEHYTDTAGATNHVLASANCLVSGSRHASRTSRIASCTRSKSPALTCYWKRSSATRSTPG